MLWIVLVFCLLVCSAYADDVLYTTNIQNCNSKDWITLEQADLTFYKSNATVVYNFIGETEQTYRLIGEITLEAYDKVVINQTVDICHSNNTDFTRYCPLDKGSFNIAGSMKIPDKYMSEIPTPAFSIPDLEGQATVRLFDSYNVDKAVGCFTVDITNGKTTKLGVVKYLTMGLAAGALLVTILTCLVEYSDKNASKTRFKAPTFQAFFALLQSVGISGLLSLQYPSVYRHFTLNFGWCLGIISWNDLQRTIDDFRYNTGGNTTIGFDYLQTVTLLYQSVSNEDIIPQYGPKHEPLRNETIPYFNATIPIDAWTSSSRLFKKRELSKINTDKKHIETVTGIKAFSEAMNIPDTNLFMTLIVWFSIILAIVSVSLLLFYGVLELWSFVNKRRRNVTGIRLQFLKDNFLMITLSVMIYFVLVFYPTWVLYAMYQFWLKDSWGSLVISGITFAFFTIALVALSCRVAFLAYSYREQLYRLYEYPHVTVLGLLFKQYKGKYWWFFNLSILCSFSQCVFIGLSTGDGMVQIIGVLAIQAVFTVILISLRPFQSTMTNATSIVANVGICIVYALLTTFTFQVNISLIPSTAIGIAIIAIQSILIISAGILILFGLFVVLYKVIYFRPRYANAAEYSQTSQHFSYEDVEPDFRALQRNSKQEAANNNNNQGVLLVGGEFSSNDSADDEASRVSSSCSTLPAVDNTLNMTSTDDSYNNLNFNTPLVRQVTRNSVIISSPEHQTTATHATVQKQPSINSISEAEQIGNTTPKSESFAVQYSQAKSNNTKDKRYMRRSLSTPVEKRVSRSFSVESEEEAEGEKQGIGTESSSSGIMNSIQNGIQNNISNVQSTPIAADSRPASNVFVESTPILPVATGWANVNESSDEHRSFTTNDGSSSSGMRYGNSASVIKCSVYETDEHNTEKGDQTDDPTKHSNMADDTDDDPTTSSVYPDETGNKQDADEDSPTSITTYRDGEREHPQ